MNFTSQTHIDFYVSVIDNYGDMGFAVNLAFTLHEKYPRMRIRFFSDDTLLFQKFFPGKSPDWIEYVPLTALKWEKPPSPSTYIFNFFDYPLPKDYLWGFQYQKTIIAFSYFLLHKGLESLHQTTYVLESGYDTVIHFVPSLLSGGGGVIVNPLLEQKKETRESFGNGLWKDVCEKKWISVFVYRKTLPKILAMIENDQSDTIFWICGDVSWLQESSHCRILPFLSLVDYGVFQSLCDANIVRGENSLCSGLLSEKPVLWDIYKENNGAHVEKIEDYIQFLSGQFPSTDWSDYARTMRGFNESRQEKSLRDFISEYHQYNDVFKIISEYIKRECNLVQKLERI